MQTMEVSVRHPAAAAVRARKDLRTTVRFRDPSLRVPLRIHFLRLTDDETGEQEFRLVGVDLGDTPRDEETALALPEVTALTLRNVTERFPRWLELARAHAVPGPRDHAATAQLAGDVKRWKPGRLDPDFLRGIAAEYRRHVSDGEPSPVTTIARSHGVYPSTASRWLKRARTQGFLEAEKGATRAS